MHPEAAGLLSGVAEEGELLDTTAYAACSLPCCLLWKACSWTPPLQLDALSDSSLLQVNLSGLPQQASGRRALLPRVLCSGTPCPSTLALLQSFVSSICC